MSIVIVLMLIGAGFYASVNKEIVEDFIDVLDKVYNDEKSFKDMWETVEKKVTFNDSIGNIKFKAKNCWNWIHKLN